MILSTILLPAIILNSGHAPKLKIKELHIGKGKAARSGDTVSVDYTGTLTNGSKFDSSIGKEPFTFHLGAHEVIKGWDQGVVGMKVGGTRKLIIPPELGYGGRAMGDKIPANSTLIFVVKLLKIDKG